MTALERQKRQTHINLTGRKVNKCGRLWTWALLQVSANVWWDLGDYPGTLGVPLECCRALCTEPWRLRANLVADLVLFYCSWKITCRFVFFTFFKWHWIHLGSRIPFWKLFFLCLSSFANILGFLQYCGLQGLWDFAKFAACAERVVFRKGFLWQLSTVEWLEVIRLLRMCN